MTRPPAAPPAPGSNSQPPAAPPPLAASRVRRLLRPLILALMAGCLALPLAQTLALMFPGAVHPELIVGACVLAALEANFSYVLIRRRFLSGADLWRFRTVEFGLYFLVLKAAQLALTGWPAELGPAGLWPGDLQTLFNVLLDYETLLTLGLAVLFAYAVSDTLSDFDRVGEPPDHDSHYVSPLESLTSRFFVGGALLLAFSGVAQVGLAELFNLDRPPVTGLVANVLLYFLLGFLLLGQARLDVLTHRWQVQGLRVPGELPARWARYSLIFLGLAVLLAFALPTGYTAGMLGILGSIIFSVLTAIWIVIALLMGLLILPFAWLLSRLLGQRLGRPVAPAPPPLPPSLNTGGPPPEWLETLRTVLVWGVIVAMVVYVLASYLRERPEIARALRQARPLRALRQLWAALRHRASGLAATIEASAPLAWLRERLRGAGPAAGPAGFFRLGGAAPREQVRYYYLSLLRRARERGLGRRPAQTPGEYRPTLARHLPDAADESRALTDAFVESQYSAHPVSAGQARTARTAYEKLRAALRDLDRRKPPPV